MDRKGEIPRPFGCRCWRISGLDLDLDWIWRRRATMACRISSFNDMYLLWLNSILWPAENVRDRNWMDFIKSLTIKRWFLESAYFKRFELSLEDLLLQSCVIVSVSYCCSTSITIIYFIPFCSNDSNNLSLYDSVLLCLNFIRPRQARKQIMVYYTFLIHFLFLSM